MATLSFNSTTKVIEVASPATNLTIQELWNQTQLFLSTHEAMSIPHFIFGAGKNDLGGGNFVGITVTLVDWCVKFADRAGPTTIVTTITGGNLVGRAGSILGAVQHPVCPSAFTFNTINQATSPGLIAAPIPDESFMEATYDEAGGNVKIGVWLERAGVVITSPTSTTVTWYKSDGTVLFTVNDTTPDAQGHFDMTVAQALATDHPYYATVAVVDASGTVTTRRGVPTAS